MKRLLPVAFVVLLVSLSLQPAPTPVGPARVPVPQIAEPVPAHLSYQETAAQLQQWQKESDGLAEVVGYGTSKRSAKLLALKVGRGTLPVLVTACIHGNEPHSAGVVVGYAGKLLAGYGQDARCTKILDERVIYFVPVVSPDSYPHSREVDGVDPNRDFPGPHAPAHESTPSVKAIQDLFTGIRPKAAWSGHTYGQVFLTPYGDSMQPCPDDARYKDLFGRIARACKYRHIRACEMYGRPIKGSEVDWYYRSGATACVCEYGTHQRKPSHDEIRSELSRTWEGFLTFCEEAPITTGGQSWTLSIPTSGNPLSLRCPALWCWPGR